MQGQALGHTASRLTLVYQQPLCVLTGVSLYGQFSPRMGVCVCQPLFLSPTPAAQAGKCTEDSLRPSLAPGGSVTMELSLMAFAGPSVQEALPSVLLVWMGPSEVEMVGLRVGSLLQREGAAPLQLCFGI